MITSRRAALVLTWLFRSVAPWTPGCGPSPRQVRNRKLAGLNRPALPGLGNFVGDQSSSDGRGQLGGRHLEWTPPCRLRARAEARPAWVHPTISSRSNSARSAITSRHQSQELPAYGALASWRRRQRWRPRSPKPLAPPSRRPNAGLSRPAPSNAPAAAPIAMIDKSRPYPRASEWKTSIAIVEMKIRKFRPKVPIRNSMTRIALRSGRPHT